MAFSFNQHGGLHRKEARPFITLTLLCLTVMVSACGQRGTDNPTDDREVAVDETPVPELPAVGPAPDSPAQRLELSTPPQNQNDEYAAKKPKSVIELQQFRQSSTIEIRDGTGNAGTAALVNLNPHINAWFLLSLQWAGEVNEASVYHLENVDPQNQRLSLDSGFASGLVIEAEGRKSQCELWDNARLPPISDARALRRPYVPVCQGRLYLRNQVTGHKTTMEWATDFLRDHVSGGEEITVFVRQNLYEDAFLNEAEMTPASSLNSNQPKPRLQGVPAAPAVDSRYQASSLIPVNLGLTLDKGPDPKVLVGMWYPVKNFPGVFVSTISPGMVSRDVIEAQKGRVNLLDEVESRALVYLVAFDLSQFQLGLALGTEHPRLNWSDRVLPEMRDPSLPGPDGIGTVAPLVRTGMTRPDYTSKLVATVTGGFKRYHGAFRRGDFAHRNHGSHYGFVENGVLMSKLHPGLATVVVYDDGRVDLKTWEEDDNTQLQRVCHARQNGVAIIEYEQATQSSRPGDLISRPALGNWSGSVEGRYRTLRSGLGIQERGRERFLIYGYFSSATPSAMAQVFQAYGCRYAMLMDMNALEHTYMALYQTTDSQFKVQQLIKGMEVLEKQSGQTVVPRFVGYADNRDFFYLLRKGADQ